MSLKIPFYAKDLIDNLRKAGFKAYAVGGAVRDSLLGRAPEDWDITTDALPYEVTELFKDKKIVPTGIKHGTVTVFNCGKAVEITTFRTEEGYKDNRHPDKVAFVRNLREDLKRRDFTVNALCIGEDGSIIDYFGGVEDLKNKTIRTVGDANQRFREDALRILRAIRFSAVYDFEIEETTKKAIFDCLYLLKDISSERIVSELIKLLKAPYCEKVLLGYKKVIFEIIPQLQATDGVFQRQDFHVYDVWEHIVHSVGNIEPVGYLRLTMLLHDVGKPPCADGCGHFKGHAYIGSKMCSQILTELNCSNKIKGKVVKLVRLHNMVAENTDENLRKLIYRHGSETMLDLIKVFKADNMAKRPEIALKRKEYYDSMEEKVNAILLSSPPLSVKDLKIKGQDIIALSVPKGPLVGKILRKVSEIASKEQLPNDKKLLIELAKEVKKKIVKE